MSAFTEFYADPTVAGASNLNAGSTQGAAFHTYAGGNWDGTSTFTVASGNPSTDGVTAGMWASIYVTAGATVATYVAQVTSVTSTTIVFSTTIKLGNVPGSGTGTLTCVVGGAWVGPAGTTTFPLSSGFNALPAGTPIARINLRNTQTYAITNGTTITISGTGPIVYQGYATTPGDCINSPSSRPVIDGNATGTVYNLVSITGTLVDFSDFVVQNNGNAGASGANFLVGITSGARCTSRRVLAQHAWSSCWQLNTDGIYLEECEASQWNLVAGTSGNVGFQTNGSSVNAITFSRCVAHDAGPGATSAAQNSHAFQIFGVVTLDHCVADTVGGSGFFVNGGGFVTLKGCSALNVGLGGGSTHGFGLDVSFAGQARVYARSCLFAKCATGAINNSNIGNYIQDLDNSYWSNGTQYNGQTGAIDSTGAVTLTGDPSTNASYGAVGTTGRAGNWTLNSTTSARYAGRGNLPQAGLYGGVAVYSPGSGTGVDAGAAQASSAAGGGGGFLVDGGLVR